MKETGHSAMPSWQVHTSNGQAGLDRRAFLETFLFSAAAATALGALPIRATAAWVPWSPPTPSLLLGEDSTPGLESEGLEIARGLALGDPAIARTEDGRIWTAWTEMVADDERIYLRSLDPASRTWSEPIHVNEGQAPSGLGTMAYQPQIVERADGVGVVWVGREDSEDRILVRHFHSDGRPVREHGPTVRGDTCRRPCHVSGGLLVWEERVEGRFVIRATTPDNGHTVISSSDSGDCMRPAQAVSPANGDIAIAHDERLGQGHRVRLCLLDRFGNVKTRNISITNHSASDIAPALAYSHDGRWLWIAWHSNRAGEDRWDIPRWFRLAAMDTETGELFEPEAPPRDMDLEKRETDQGWEFVQIVACPDGGVWVIGRPSHNWCIQKYHGGEWSPIYRLPVDGWGGRGKRASALLDDEGALWVARRDIRANAIQRIGGAVSDEVLEPELVRLGEPEGRTLVNVEQPVRFPAESVGEEGDAENPNFYFGDIHGHTYMSDGMGDVDEYFLRCRDLHGDDFCACTDHDNFVGQRLLNSEYEEHRRAVEHFHDDGRFVTLYAQEWTTARPTRPTGYGHINFYSKTPDHPMMDHLDPRWQHQRDVMAVCREHGMIGGPHHVAWVGHRWEEHDPEVIRFVEMCSVHGVFEYEGNLPIPHRGNFPGCFVQDGLALGMKFGFVGGSDQHGLIWHHRVCWKRDAYRSGLTGVLAPELTRDAVFDALKNRRTFATTGVKIRLGFKVNGAIMGSEITSDGPPQIHVDLVSPTTDIRWVDLVRSNERILRYGGESLQTFFSFTDDDCPVGEESWYYLRVILDDDNMAWSSPIWVTRAA
jgi:hypothetical protein